MGVTLPSNKSSNSKWGFGFIRRWFRKIKQKNKNKAQFNEGKLDFTEDVEPIVSLEDVTHELNTFSMRSKYQQLGESPKKSTPVKTKAKNKFKKFSLKHFQKNMNRGSSPTKVPNKPVEPIISGAQVSPVKVKKAKSKKKKGKKYLTLDENADTDSVTDFFKELEKTNNKDNDLKNQSIDRDSGYGMDDSKVISTLDYADFFRQCSTDGGLSPDSGFSETNVVIHVVDQQNEENVFPTRTDLAYEDEIEGSNKVKVKAVDDPFDWEAPDKIDPWAPYNPNEMNSPSQTEDYFCDRQSSVAGDEVSDDKNSKDKCDSCGSETPIEHLKRQSISEMETNCRLMEIMISKDSKSGSYSVSSHDSDIPFPSLPSIPSEPLETISSSEIDLQNLQNITAHREDMLKKVKKQQKQTKKLRRSSKKRGSYGGMDVADDIDDVVYNITEPLEEKRPSRPNSLGVAVYDSVHGMIRGLGQMGLARGSRYKTLEQEWDERLPEEES